MVHITNENKNLQLFEKVVDGEYYCGQFDQNRYEDEGIFHGYGFSIPSKGIIKQGLFIHGLLYMPHSRVCVDSVGKGHYL